AGRVQAVVGGVLGDQEQLARAVGGELPGLAQDLIDGLGDVLAAHGGDGAEGAEAVAALGDLEVGEVARGDAQPGGVFQGADGGGPEEGALLVGPAVPEGAVEDLGDLLAAEDADDVVDAGDFLEQVVLPALGE